MKTIYTALLIVSFAAIVMVGSASAATVDLVEKDGAWNRVSGGNYGTLTYSIDASETLTYNFVVHDSDTLLGDHILVVIAPELSGNGWPLTGSMALSDLSGTADISGHLGNINDGADYDGTVYGAKIWYVPTTGCFDGTKFTAFPRANMLLEEDLIKPDTTPIPEFATIAIPVVGILGLVLFFNHRKHRKE